MTKIQKLEKSLKEERSKQKFAVFYSPGTFISESDPVKISGPINLKKLVKKAKSISQRYGAKPYGFAVEDGNEERLFGSGMYYITGKLIKYDDIPDDDKRSILKGNMRCNNHPICIENNNSYKFTGQFEKEDVILDWDGNIVIKGNDADLLEYRKLCKKKFDDYYKKL